MKSSKLVSVRDGDSKRCEIFSIIWYLLLDRDGEEGEDK